MQLRRRNFLFWARLWVSNNILIRKNGDKSPDTNRIVIMKKSFEKGYSSAFLYPAICWSDSSRIYLGNHRRIMLLRAQLSGLVMQHDSISCLISLFPDSFNPCVHNFDGYCSIIKSSLCNQLRPTALLIRKLIHSYHFLPLYSIRGANSAWKRSLCNFHISDKSY